MPSKTLPNVVIRYSKALCGTAEHVETVCRTAIPFIEKQWRLKRPPLILIRVSTNWLGFWISYAWRHISAMALMAAILLLIRAPYELIIVPSGLYLLAIAVILRRYARTWKVAAGWTSTILDSPRILVKAPELLEKGDLRMGRLLFIPEENKEKKLAGTVNHELTHAYAGHLHLPFWLNEGLALVSSETFLGKRTVRGETLALLAPDPESGSTYAGLARDMRMQLRECVKGYWLVRYLKETRPQLIVELLELRHSPGESVKRIAAALEIIDNDPWPGIFSTLREYFQEESRGK